jgi:hypothetical protein
MDRLHDDNAAMRRLGADEPGLPIRGVAEP